MSTQRIALGKKGESLVATYLTQRGWTIRCKNFRQKCGEIDIIAQKGQTIIFTEVKLRVNPLFALADLITPTKQQKIIKTALYYIAQHHLTDHIIRFDVALLEKQAVDYTITYIEHAFTQEFS